MWLERILIIWNTLGHGYRRPCGRVFLPTAWDWPLLAGSLGFFAFLYPASCASCRPCSMHEVRELAYDAQAGACGMMPGARRFRLARGARGRAARAVRDAACAIIDAFTPFPVEGLAEFLPATDRGMRAIMLAAGLAFAALRL